MPLADKNILITPNRGQTADPTIVFSGANVSVGPQNITATALPLSNGTVSFSGSAGQLFSITNSLTGSIFSVNDVSGIPSIEVNSSGVVTLAQFSGNVGIGTGTPGQKLTVIGTIALGVNTDNQSSRIQVADGTSGVADARFLFRNGTDTQAALRLVVNNTNFVALDSVQANNSAVSRNLILQPNGGSLGIGISNPTNTFEVGTGSSDTRAVFRSSSAYPLGVQSGSGFAGWIGGSGVADNMVFSSSGGAERMRINASGNLGIGSNNPGARLTVAGNSVLANNTGIDPDDYANQVVAGAIADGSGFGLTAAIGGNAGAGDSWALGHNGLALFLGMGNGTEPNSLTTYLQCATNRNLFLNPQIGGGRVGIGTESPSSRLHVAMPDAALDFNAGIYIQSNITNGTAGRGGGISFQNLDVVTAGIYGIRQTASWQGALVFYTHTSASGNTFGTTFTEKMRLNDVGNLGIGTTDPAVTLDMGTRTDAVRLPQGTTAQRPGTPSEGMFRLNTQLDTLEFYDTGVWKSVNTNYSVEFLLVAGGGGGGFNAGAGGGAGGLISSTATVNGGLQYQVVVGGGGAGRTSDFGTGDNGQNSTAFGFTAIGGGGGKSSAGSGASGGSGGGGAAGGVGGSGTAGQGNAGGNGNGSDGAARSGAGGGGAGAAGQNTPNNNQGGAGGVGINWLGLGTFYAGGGGGSPHTGPGGAGGAGGGGAGGTGGSTNGTAGTANTGGGGGAGGGFNFSGANGGSGVCIIRYAGTPRGTGGAITQSGGFTFHTFTGSGTFTA